MNSAQSHIRNAIATAVIWALSWAIVTLVAGTVLGWISDFSLEKHVDPMLAMAMPGFILGLVFYTALASAHKPLNLKTLTLRKLSTWGFGVGFFCGLAALFMGSPNPEYSPVQVYLTIVCVSSLLSLFSAQFTYWILHLLKQHSFS